LKKAKKGKKTENRSTSEKVKLPYPAVEVWQFSSFLFLDIFCLAKNFLGSSNLEILVCVSRLF
jgi:hypothetical protein